MTIRTVTLSPGFDHLITIDDVTAGGVDSVLSWEIVAGGKGVNASRTAAWLGADSVAYTLVGEEDEDQFRRLVERSGATAVTVAVPGETRRNLTLTVQASAETASHATSPRIATASDHHAISLLDRLLAEVQPNDVVTLNGAVPDGVDHTIWARAAEALLDHQVTLIADVQSDALRELLAARGVITMAKPNLEEARALVPDTVAGSTTGTAGSALETMAAAGVRDPIVSMGADGVAHLLDGVPTRSWCAASAVRAVVGAGDAFIAGYCSALDSPRWSGIAPLSLGLAVSSAVVAGTSRDDMRESVRQLLSRVRSEPRS